MFSPMNLFVGIVTGGFGAGYFIYGKRQEKFIFMIDGVALCVYPYLFSNLFWLITVGLILVAVPFLWRGAE